MQWSQTPTPTTISNQQFDLVSVLYHSLQAAQTYDCYVKDAEGVGDQELAQFFRQLQQEDNARAERARQLLASRFGMTQAGVRQPGTGPGTSPGTSPGQYVPPAR